MVSVKPILDRLRDWPGNLAGNDSIDDLELMRPHGRTSRLLGDRKFIRDQEAMTGKKLTPG